MNLKSFFSNVSYPCLFIFCFAFTFYPLLQADFLRWDDPANIIENSRLQVFSLRNILFFWEGPFENLYIPVTYTLWAMATLFSKFLAGAPHAPPNATVFHALNLGHHLLNSLFVYFLLKNLIQKKTMIDVSDENLSIRCQCELLGLSRSSLYYEAHPESYESLNITNHIDKIHTD